MDNKDNSTGYIGKRVSRPNAWPLLNGQGKFVDDLNLPGMLHVYFIRSPYSHANIVSVDKEGALEIPGVVAVVSGEELLEFCKPWEAKLTHLPPMKSTFQYALPPKRACYQGEPVVAVVAESRALAEDAAEMVYVDWEELPHVASREDALAEGAALVHPEMETNVAWTMDIEEGDINTAFASSDIVVEQEFSVGRQTCMTLEPRGIIANYCSADESLTTHHASQVPHIQRAIYSKQLGIKESKVRIICPDVGGGFGLKLHCYSDEIATAALSVMLKKPIKFIPDRLESFISDIHCRDHSVKAKMGIDSEGKIQALQVKDVAAGGAYLVYPRTSLIEPLLVAVCTPLAYDMANYHGSVSLVYQNKVPTGQYRGVGMPVASLVMEGMMDEAARKSGIEKVEIRKRNLRPDGVYPCKSVSGETLDGLSQHAAMDKLLEMSSYGALRDEQKLLREKGIYRGIGLVSIVEGTSPSPALYAAGGAPISSRDACTLRLESDGTVTCLSSLTEQGQGAYSVINQIVADTLGMKMEDINVIMGDTVTTPFGGGTWASRGTAIAGEAALEAGISMRKRILDAVSTLKDVSSEQLDIIDGEIVELETKRTMMTLEELGRTTHFRTAEFPEGFDPALIVTEHYSQRKHMMLYANCSMCVTLDVDINTGAVKLHKVWVVEDCGKVINPLLVDEQIRGGVIQGIGGSLYEECIYDDEGQLRNCTLADYLVPMAGEMPDIEIAHIETPTEVSKLGAKGCGEAGLIAVTAAIMSGINDALEPLNASVTSQPFTPEKILRAIGTI